MVGYVLSACLVATVGVSAVIPSVEDTVTLREWLVCGPFSVGIREGIAGVVEDFSLFQLAENDSFRTTLTQGGIARTRKVSADAAGWVETDYPDVRWDSIQDFYGTCGLFAAGYAYAEFDLPRAYRGLVVATRVASFYLNGLLYQGDAYGTGRYLQPVLLDSGTNRVLVVLSGFGDQRFRFQVVPCPSPVVAVCQDATVPDLVGGADDWNTSFQPVWLGIPVLNTTGQRVDSVRLVFKFGSDSVLCETTLRHLAPLCCRKVPVRLVLPAVPEESSSLYLVVSVTNPAEFTDTVRFRVRRPEAPRMETFISAIDGSCQYYGILYPKDYDRSRRYGLILSLHGAGCEASGQVEAYRPKDWAFVVAPTNRRPYGFDWQDWGRLDALEVLDLCLGKLPIDPERVLLTGHSMGGHGTWHVGLAHPDRFAALAPCAGWPSFQLYIPWFLQRSETFAEPDQLAVRDRALAPDNVPALLPNALNLPVFILHGADDDNVPTFHGRSFAGWLSELRYDYQYKEVPNRSHWWQYETESLSVIDDADLMAFLAEQRRNPGPRHIRFRTADLGQSNRAYWMTIERVRTVGRMAEIEAWAEDTLVRVRTRNTAQLSLDLDERLFFRTTAAIEIDGQNLGKVKALPAHIVAHRDKGQWRLGPARAAGRRKVPGLYGPAKQAMFRPFVIAYGTQNPALTNFLGHAAAQEAMRWWQRANGLAEVLPDTEVTREHVEQYNIVLYGGPGENSYTRRISPGLPIRVSEGQMFLADRKLGSSLACLFVFPNPDNPDRLVLVRMGTDPASTRLSMFWGLVYSGAGVPDFMVWDTGVRRLGWAGVRAAGFFDPFWRLDPVSTWIQE